MLYKSAKYKAKIKLNLQSGTHFVFFLISVFSTQNSAKRFEVPNISRKFIHFSKNMSGNNFEFLI